MVKFLHYNKLNNLYQQTFPGRKKLSKSMTIKELLNRYFDEIGDIEKRCNEKKNVEQMLEYDKSTQDFQFLILCDVLVPVDVIVSILKFVGYNSSTLFTIGRVCQMLYITILSSWPHVKITKENVFKQSILVLRSVRSVTFMPVTYSYYTYKSFLNSDFDFIFTHLNPTRIRSISLTNFKIRDYVKFLRYICRKKHKSTKNVTIFRYGCLISGSHDFYNFSVTKEDARSFKPPWKGVLLRNAFPILQSIYSPLNFQILEGLEHLETIFVNLSLPNKIITSSSSQYSLETIGTIQRDKGLRKESIQDLSLIVSVNDSSSIQNLPNFLTGFHSLKRFVINVVDKHSNYHKSAQDSNKNQEVFDLTQILYPVKNSLKELKISDLIYRYGKIQKEFSAYPYIYPSHTSNLGFNYFLPNLSKLSIVGSNYFLKIQHLILCLESVNLKELETSALFTLDDEKLYSVSLLERFRMRLFEFERLNLSISWNFPFTDTRYNMYSINLLKLEIRSSNIFKHRRISRPTFTVELHHNLRDKWGRFERDSHDMAKEQVEFLDLRELLFLNDFVEAFPSICSKYPQKVIRLLDKSFRCYLFIQTKNKKVKDLSDPISNNIVDSEEKKTRRYRKSEFKGDRFYSVFNTAMERENYKVELIDSHDENETRELTFSQHTWLEYKNFRELFREFWFSKIK